MSNEPHKTDEQTNNTGAPTSLVVMSVLGFLTFIWLGAITVFPSISPWAVDGGPSKGVVVLDMTAYMINNPDLSPDDVDAVWSGAVALSKNLSSQGFVVVRPDYVVDAPESAYIPDSLITKWSEK